MRKGFSRFAPPSCHPHGRGSGIYLRKERDSIAFNQSDQSGCATTDSDHSVTPRAPTKDLYNHYASHLLTIEHQCILRLQVETLIDNVNADLEIIHPNRGHSLSEEAVFIIFLICKNMKLSEMVKFAALEIYDRFMINFNDTMKTELSHAEEKLIVEHLRRVKAQTILRIVSCIQLASKIHADKTSPYISSEQARTLLKSMGKSYTIGSINLSERRVMRTLDHKLKHVTSLEIFEGILLSLDLDRLSYNQCYDLGLEILDWICREHEVVYTMLHKNCKAKHFESTSSAFRKLEFNKAVEALGILGCTLFVVLPLTHKRFFPAMETLSGIPQTTFMDLAAVLVGLFCKPT